MSGCTNTANYVYASCACICHRGVGRTFCVCDCNRFTAPGTITVSGTSSTNDYEQVYNRIMEKMAKEQNIGNDHEKRIKDIEHELRIIHAYLNDHKEYAHKCFDDYEKRIENLEKQRVEKTEGNKLKKRGWMNIYSGYSGNMVYESKEEADRNGDLKLRVACVKVEWEE